MSPVNSMFVCIKKKKNGKMLNIGADNRSTPSLSSILNLNLIDDSPIYW